MLIQPQCPQLTTDVLRVSDPDSNPAELVFSSLANLNTEAGHLEHQDYPSRLVLYLVRLYSASQIFLQSVTEVYWGGSCIYKKRNYICKNEDGNQEIPEKGSEQSFTETEAVKCYVLQ